MMRLLIAAVCATLLVACAASAPPASDAETQVDHGQLPEPVWQVLDQYLNLLAHSRSIEECSTRFASIAGGTLVNEDGRSLRATVPKFSLKKDFQNVRFYALPPRITRVDVTRDVTTGYGPSALHGTRYKIWVAKAEGQAGMPAPIAILVPEQHPSVRDPKVVGIGSL